MRSKIDPTRLTLCRVDCTMNIAWQLRLHEFLRITGRNFAFHYLVTFRVYHNATDFLETPIAA